MLLVSVSLRKAKYVIAKTNLVAKRLTIEICEMWSRQKIDYGERHCGSAESNSLCGVYAWPSLICLVYTIKESVTHASSARRASISMLNEIRDLASYCYFQNWKEHATATELDEKIGTRRTS